MQRLAHDWPADEPGRRMTMLLDRECRPERAPRVRRPPAAPFAPILPALRVVAEWRDRVFIPRSTCMQ